MKTKNESSVGRGIAAYFAFCAIAIGIIIGVTYVFVQPYLKG